MSEFEFVALPSIVEWRNAGQACDMLVGPCACGAFHFWADVESRAAQAFAERRPPAPERLTTPAMEGERELAAQAGRALRTAYLDGRLDERKRIEVEAAEKGTAPVPMLLHCPECRTRHVDAGEFATKPHHTHSCQECGLTWRPALGPTVGVQFLPGFKNGGVEGASVQKYRDRVIQLESLIARIKMVHVLEPTTARIVDHVFDTSIAKTEPGQFSETVIPLETVVEGLDKAR